jgi:hypothetical protein
MHAGAFYAPVHLVFLITVFGHHLIALALEVTVGDLCSSLNAVDVWQQISDQTLRVVHPVTLTGAFGHVDLCPNRGPTAFSKGLLI